MPGTLVDTGALVAWFDRRDGEHRRVTAFFDEFRSRLLTGWPVLVETVHLLPAHAGVRFLRWVKDGGATIHELPPAAIVPIAALVEKYSDTEMDVTDASLLWLADQLRVFDIITTDARHFRTYRTPSGRALRNLI